VAIRHNLEYDQLILEFYKSGEPDSGWVHISYNGSDNRKQNLLAYKDDNNKTRYKPW